MKKKIIIISILVFVIVTIFLAIRFVNEYTIENFKFYVQMLGVDKDIIIERKRNDFPAEGGFATISYYYYVDLDKKKIYEIEDYYIYGVTTKIGESGSHYSIEGTKELSDEEINDMLKLIEIKQSSNENSSTDDIFSNVTYYTIKYKDKTGIVSGQDALPLEKILSGI